MPAMISTIGIGDARRAASHAAAAERRDQERPSVVFLPARRPRQRRLGRAA